MLDHCQCNVHFDDIYYSRVSIENEVSLCPRRNPVVWSSDRNSVDDGLTADQLDFYDEYGYIVLPSLFSKVEINELLHNITDTYLPDIAHRKDLLVMEQNGQDVRSAFEYHKHPVFQEIISDSRILSKVEQILNSHAYIHQSRINFQKAFTGQGFSWHSDFETWHCEDGMPLPRALSAVIMLDDTFAFNGALMVVPGSHKSYAVSVGETPERNWETSLVDQRVGGPSGQQLKCLFEGASRLTSRQTGVNTCEDSSSTPASSKPTHGVQYVEGLAGTVFFFDSNLMHGSHSNISPLDRRSLYMVYNSMENQLKDEPYCAPNTRPERLATRDPVWIHDIKRD